MFCNHQWESRTGYDSGSQCSRCGKVTERELVRTLYNESAHTNELQPGKTLGELLFCHHHWESKSGYDTGATCTRCGKQTDREVARHSHTGRGTGELEPASSVVEKLRKAFAGKGSDHTPSR